MAPDFNEYIRQGEPDKRGKAYAWRTAIGLQAVDGLQTSEYLKDTARKHIEGEISIDEARDLIKAYYKSKVNREPDDDQKHEADGVSANITKILSSNTLNFSTNGYISIHRRIFSGVLKNAGKIRDYNISKKEWVLDGDSVSYLNWEDLRMALDYDMEQERHFSYKGLSKDELITHIAHFISDLWQIHPFCEGNTRTTAVFAIQYLRSIGFDVNNDLFANHSWYFRNALFEPIIKMHKKVSITHLYIWNDSSGTCCLASNGNSVTDTFTSIHRLNGVHNRISQQDKHRTSTGQASITSIDNPYVARLISVMNG